MGKKRVVKEIENNVINHETGEILSTEQLKEWSIPREEPDYVKLYFNAILEFNEISCANTPVLMALVKYMTYADDSEGGQLICLNSYIRKKICEQLKIKPDTLTRNIASLCKGKILKKLATNVYQANPYLLGKGDWASIKNLRAEFDWERGFVVTETVHEK